MAPHAAKKQPLSVQLKAAFCGKADASEAESDHPLLHPPSVFQQICRQCVLISTTASIPQNRLLDKKLCRLFPCLDRRFRTQLPVLIQHLAADLAPLRLVHHAVHADPSSAAARNLRNDINTLGAVVIQAESRRIRHHQIDLPVNTAEKRVVRCDRIHIVAHGIVHPHFNPVALPRSHPFRNVKPE